MTVTPGHPDRRAVAQMFDAIARRYDFLNHLLSAGFDRRWRRHAVRTLRLQAGDVLLDVCAGTADLALTAAEAQPELRRAVCLDLAPAMLAVARRKIAAQHLSPPIDVAVADAEHLPLADGSVDGVMVGFGIRNVEDASAALREMRRVLKRGGRLAILEFSLPSQPVLRTLFLVYFRHVLPIIGRLISGHASAYSYLPASVIVFPSSEGFVRGLREAGFGDVTIRPLTAGIACLYTAQV